VCLASVVHSYCNSRCTAQNLEFMSPIDCKVIGRRADLQALSGPLVLSHRYSYANLLLAKIGPALDHGAEAERDREKTRQVRGKKGAGQGSLYLVQCSVVSRSSGRDKLRHFAPRPDPVRHLQWLPACKLPSTIIRGCHSEDLVNEIPIVSTAIKPSHSPWRRSIKALLGSLQR
jgi:hypothetical protein